VSNTSATGGYLLPAPSPAPLEGQALLDFVQAWVVGITNLPGDLVRPYWQSEPPNVPTAGTAWCAFRVTTRPSDEYPFVGFQSGSDTYEMQRHETLDVLASFYDLGSGGLADQLAAQLRDGAMVAQNREPLTAAGMGLTRTGTPTAVPVLLKQRWQYRVDLEVVLRREIQRSYPVETLESVAGDLYTDTGLPPEPIS
jgi:hypothetical protein